MPAARSDEARSDAALKHAAPEAGSHGAPARYGCWRETADVTFPAELPKEQDAPCCAQPSGCRHEGQGHYWGAPCFHVPVDGEHCSHAEHCSPASPARYCSREPETAELDARHYGQLSNCWHGELPHGWA